MTLSAFAALCPCLAAAQPVVGPYVSLGEGVNLQQDEIIKPNALVTGINHEYSLDTGFAGAASVGYGMGYGFRIEGEGNYLTNTINGHGPNAEPVRSGGSEQKYGGFGNILYDFDFGLPVYPYIGVGIGGEAVEHDHFFSRSLYAAPFPGGTNTQVHGDYAYQGVAGAAVPFPPVPGLSFTLNYRFVGLFDPVGNYQSAYYSHAYSTGVLTTRKFTNDYNHTVLAGVRYALWQPPPPPPAPVASPPPPAPAPEPARTYLVFFDWDRADLTARARQIVSEAAQASTHVATTRIEVDGYTDLSGTAADNQRLSVRRAESVESALLRDGVPQGEISIHGYGESNPLVPTAPGVREPQNRRVEIILR